jgi:hypothetical protein
VSITTTPPDAQVPRPGDTMPEAQRQRTDALFAELLADLRAVRHMAMMMEMRAIIRDELAAAGRRDDGAPSTGEHSTL